MMTRPVYDDETRAEYVAMLAAEGYPTKEGALTAVANQTGVPARTLSRWFNGESNPPPDKLVKQKKGLLAEKLEFIAEKILDKMADKIDDANLQQSATSLGIVIDKMQLLQGQPTSITRAVSLLKEGKISPDEIKERWPNIADKLFTEAGIYFD